MAGATGCEVLIVDDAQPSVAGVAALLQDAGFHTRCCSSGNEALQEIARRTPDLVLLRVTLSEMDGVETCRRIRLQYRANELPIVLVHSEATTDEIVRGLEAGANDYVAQSFDTREVLVRLQAQARMSEYRREVLRQAQLTEKNLQLCHAMGDAFPEAVLLHDSKGAVVYLNRAARRLVTQQQSRDARSFLSAVPVVGLAAKLTELYGELSVHDRWEGEFEAEGRSLQVLSLPVSINSADPLRLWVMRDTTKVRALERAVNQRVRLETVGLFAAGIAHNFNNFLGTIRGGTDLLHAALQPVVADNDRAARYLGLIEQGVESAAALADKMAFLRSSVYEAVEEGTEPYPAVEECLDGLREHFPSVVFEVEVPKALPAVWMSRAHLVSVLRDVVENAAEAYGKERGTVSIRASLQAAGQAIELTVEDHGSGMPRGTAERIFEPFFSTKEAERQRGMSVQGRGLGMWNVYNLVTLAQGTISVQSSPGQGTVVRIVLPRWRFTASGVGRAATR